MAKKEKEAPAAEAAPAEGAEGEAAPKKGKKKIIIIAVVAILAIVGGVLGSGVLGGKKPAVDEHGEPIEAAAEDAHGGGGDGHGDAHGDGHGAKAAGGHGEPSKPVYYELPEFLVNLNPQGSSSRVSFLKMTVTLELRDAEAVVTMDANKPRIQDVFNTYLRELRPSDIQGSAGIYRLRTDLVSRLNSSLEDGAVKDILFGEIIVQ